MNLLPSKISFPNVTKRNNDTSRFSRTTLKSLFTSAITCTRISLDETRFENTLFLSEENSVTQM